MKNYIVILFSVLFMTAYSQDRPSNPNPKHFWHKEKTVASPDTIWKIWTNVGDWKDWDTGLKDASLNGDFELYTTGEIISLEGRKSKFRIVDFKAGKSYTIQTKLPLSSLYVKRFMSEENGAVYITHEVWFKGFTAGMFAKLFGRKFMEMLPGVVQNVKKIAEQ